MSFKKVVVIGGGVLGSQIAYQTAFKGFDVTVWLRSEGSVERAKPKFERLHGIYVSELNRIKGISGAEAKLFPRGLARDVENVSESDVAELVDKADRAYANLKLSTDLKDAVKDADLIIEALAEDPKQKIEFYSMLAPLLEEKTIVATNSSTLLPSTFAEYTGRPEKFLALHFANEIWKNNTAEVMGHGGTHKKYYDEVANFAEEIGMIPLLLKKEQPGYILNSMLVPFLSAAQELLAKEVADVETIDKTWMLATGAPVGPFRILDVVGLQTAYNIASMKPGAEDPETTQGKIVKILKEYIDAGKTGINAGEGFYKYR